MNPSPIISSHSEITQIALNTGKKKFGSAAINTASGFSPFNLHLTCIKMTRKNTLCFSFKHIVEQNVQQVCQIKRQNM